MRLNPPVDTFRGWECSWTVATLFNATPAFLTVELVPSQGAIAVPGQDLGLGDESEGSYTFELWPYGYLPLYTVANNNGHNLTIQVNIYDKSYSSSDTVMSFTFGNDGCNRNSYNVWNISYVDGYHFDPPSYPNTQWGAEA